MKTRDSAGGFCGDIIARAVIVAVVVFVIAAASRLGMIISRAASGSVVRGEYCFGGWGGRALVGNHQFGGGRFRFRTMRSGPGAALGGREATTMLPALFGRAATTAVLLAGEGARIAADGGGGERNPSRDSEIRTQRNDSNQMPPGGESQYVSLEKTHRMPLAIGANGSTLIVCRY